MAVKADITIDIDKQVGNLQNLTNIYNARVGDNKTPLTVLWRKNGMALNLKGLHAFIAGKVGDGSYNSETDKVDFPVGTPVVKYEDDGSGTLDNGQSGLTTLLIPKQMWAKTGLFAGYIGLKDENGSVFTSKDIFFKVLGNVLDAGVAINYFIGDFDKALAKAEKELEDKSTNFDQTTTQALQDLHDKYLAKAQKAEDTLGDTQIAIDNNLASLKRISASASALQAQLDADNLETQAGHYADLENLKADFDKKIGNMAKHPVQAFDSLAQLQAKYPNGADGDFVTVDTGHIYIYSWLTNSWKDCGAYQSQGIADNQITSKNLVAKATPVSTVFSSEAKIDYASKKLIIDKDKYISLNSTSYSGQIPTGTYDLDIDSDGVFVAFNPETKTIVGYKSYAEIPDNQIYLGWVLWSDQICNFVFPVNDGKIKSSSVSAVWSNPLKIDYSKKSLTIDGFVTIYSTSYSGQIPTGTYDLNIDSDGVFVAFNPETKTIAGYKSYAEIPDNQLYLGWVLWSDQNCNFVFPVAQDIVDTRIAPKAYNLTAAYNLAPVVDYENKKIKIIDHQTIIFTNFDKYAIDYGDHGPDHDTVVSFVSFNAENKKLNFYDDFYALPESEYYLGWIDWADRISNLVFSAGTKITKQWAGKKITCLGDSITNGDSTGTGVDVPSWVERMARFIGTNPTKNALDGARVTKDLIRMSQSIKDQDLITIFAGINDFQNSDPLGSMSDSSENTTTFYGCLKYLVLHLSEQNPVAKFLFITPMKTTKFKYHTFDENGNLMKNADGHTQLDYVNAIKQVADYYSIPVLDLYTASNYSPYIPTQVGKDSFTLDGLHPTIKGYERLSRTIANAINNL